MSTATYPRLDRDDVLRAITGREEDVLRAAGLTDEQLGGRHQPCPKCGGTDRFRYDRQGKWCICSQCFSTGNGDILAAVQWLAGCDFPEALRIAAQAVGYIAPANGNGTPAAPRKMTPTDRMDAVTRLKGIPGGADSLRHYGADVSEDDNRVAVPCIGPSGEVCSFLRVDDQGEKRFDKGKPSGMFFPVTWADGMTPIVRLPKPGETWQITEGAFDAATCGHLGYLAAGLPTKKMNPKFASLFLGVTCIIVADRDEPGHTGAESTAATLTGIAKAVKVVHLPPYDQPIPDSGGDDIRDVLRQWGEPMVRRLIDDAIAEVRGAVAPVFKAAELLADDSIQESEVLVDDLIRRREIMGVNAAPKVGKTWLTEQFAISCAMGTTWLGRFPVSRPLRVLLCDNELQVGSLRKRLGIMTAKMEVAAADLENLDITSLRGNLASIDALFSEIEPDRYDIVILDAIYKAYPDDMDENSNADWTRLIGRLDQYAQSGGYAVVYVHHTSKGDQGAKGKTDVGSGGGAQARAVDNHVVIREHENSTDDAMLAVIESSPRTFPTQIKETLRWIHPGWTVDHMTQPVVRSGASKAKRPDEERRGVESVLELLGKCGPMTKTAIRDGLSCSTGVANRWIRIALGQQMSGDVITLDTPVIRVSDDEGQRNATKYEAIPSEYRKLLKTADETADETADAFF